MSRHRFVRNMNIQDELDEDEYDEDPFEGITPAQQSQLDDATEAVLSVLGSAKGESLIVSEAEIRRALWDSYFDVDGTAEWALDETKKRKAAKEKKEKKAAVKKVVGQPPQPASKPATPTASGANTPVKKPSTTISLGGKLSPIKLSSTSSTPLKPNSAASTSGTKPSSQSGAVPAVSWKDKTWGKPASQLEADMEGMNLRGSDLVAIPDKGEEDEEEVDGGELPPPKMTIAREKVLEEAKKAAQRGVGEDGKKSISLVVVGHVDAGKSTLMGRLSFELGKMEEKKRREHERESGKAGKASFMWAWEMDGLSEERARGVTIDISQTTLSLPTTQLTILDAPGHRDFIPNMISGASQADAALLVIDAGVGEFEAGFAGGGQSREHIILVRSLGVGQVVVAVNKLDSVNYSRARYEEIVAAMKPFLVQSGYHPSKTSFVPCAAFSGLNLVEKPNAESDLGKWWKGKDTLVEAIDKLTPPARPIEAPLRFPISNVFKSGGAGGGLSSGIGVSGRVCSGVVQIGERLRILPGDETAVVRTIESEDQSVPWAAAGTNVTLYLSQVDPVQLNIGSVLCPPSDIAPMASALVAQIIVFETQIPITAGASVELFHHSRDSPASVSKLIASLDRTTGQVVKNNPRFLSKGMSAKVQVSLRSGTLSAPSTRSISIPIETFATNKEMGRILLRRGGETIAAGIVLEIIP